MEVIVLAGGLGTRLRSVVNDIPKCMAPIGGRPFLGYLLDWLQMYPVKHVVFSIGYLGEQVKEYVEAGKWSFTYDFAIETQPLGTGGGIRLALTYCKEEVVHVVNGDTFFPINLADMPSSAPITVALKPMRQFSRYGAVELEGTRIKAFREKQYCEEGLINGGIYAIRPADISLDILPQRFSFESEVLEPGAAIGAINGWETDSYFIDIGIPEDYSRAGEELPLWFRVQKASSAAIASKAQVLFLDRDGVINRLLPGDYVKKWEEFHFIPGIKEAMALWNKRFKSIVLVTNQRGVGKGLMSDADLSRIHARMMTEIMDAGGRIDLILTCTALSDEDPRRKPNVGMFLEACKLLPGLKPEDCIMIGDTPSDAAFAANCGMQFILL